MNNELNELKRKNIVRHKHPLQIRSSAKKKRSDKFDKLV